MSQFTEAGIPMAPSDGLFGSGHWQSVELRYGHYTRTNGPDSQRPDPISEA